MIKWDRLCVRLFFDRKMQAEALQPIDLSSGVRERHEAHRQLLDALSDLKAARRKQAQ